MKKMIKAMPILIAAMGLTAPAMAGTHWGYEGKGNPKNWAKLTPEYQMCDLGRNQSPVNVSGAIKAQVTDLEIHYGETSGNIVNNGHTVQINEKNPNDYIVINGEKYTLVQFHFHAPSENEINGESFPLEGHFVHQNDKGELLVMAIMFEEGEGNPVVEKLLSILSKEVNTPVNFEHINIAAFLPESTGYYRFSGSLTTPPCTEGVTWVILKDTMTLSKDEIEKFEHAFKHHNNRPLQPLYGRLIISN